MGFKSQDDNPLSFDVTTNHKEFRLNQDVSAYINHAEKMREKDRYQDGARTTYRPMFVVPDIVAIDIKMRYGLDIHAPEFSSDKTNFGRLAAIIRKEFPYLITSDAARSTETGAGSGIIIK